MVIPTGSRFINADDDSEKNPSEQSFDMATDDPKDAPKYAKASSEIKVSKLIAGSHASPISLTRFGAKGRDMLKSLTKGTLTPEVKHSKARTTTPPDPTAAGMAELIRQISSLRTEMEAGRAEIAELRARETEFEAQTKARETQMWQDREAERVRWEALLRSKESWPEELKTRTSGRSSPDVESLLHPGTFGTSSRDRPRKWYAVARGRKPGVYTDWSLAEEQVEGYRGAVFELFDLQADAEAYVWENQAETREAESMPATGQGSVG